MQRKWKKAVAALTVAALGMTTFAGCGGSTASDGSVRQRTHRQQTDR